MLWIHSNINRDLSLKNGCRVNKAFAHFAWQCPRDLCADGCTIFECTIFSMRLRSCGSDFSQSQSDYLLSLSLSNVILRYCKIFCPGCSWHRQVWHGSDMRSIGPRALHPNNHQGIAGSSSLF